MMWRACQIFVLLVPVGQSWVHESRWLKPALKPRLLDGLGASPSPRDEVHLPTSPPNLNPAQKALLLATEKALKKAQARSIASDKIKSKRFRFKANHRAKGAVPLFVQGSKGVVDYMGLPLETYNLKVASVDVVDSYVTFTDGGFRLNLPLGGLLQQSNSGGPLAKALDGLSLVCDVDVSHDPSKRANTFTCRKLAFALEAARVAEDAKAKAADAEVMQSFNKQFMSNQTRAQAAGFPPLPNAGGDESGGTLKAVTTGEGGKEVARPPLPSAMPGAMPGAGAELKEVPAEVLGATARELTRILAMASVEVTGEAAVEWGAQDSGFGKVATNFPWGASSRDSKVLGTTPAAEGSETVPLQLRAKGQVEFTAQGLFAWLPSPLVNGLGSTLASAVLRVLAPQFLKLLAKDYERWAQDLPRLGNSNATATGADVAASLAAAALSAPDSSG